MDRLLSARQIQEARTRGGGEEYLVYGLTLLGEQLLAGGEIHRAQEILLPQTGHREGSVALGLLQLLVMRGLSSSPELSLTDTEKPSKSPRQMIMMSKCHSVS